MGTPLGCLALMQSPIMCIAIDTDHLPAVSQRNLPALSRAFHGFLDRHDMQAFQLSTGSLAITGESPPSLDSGILHRSRSYRMAFGVGRRQARHFVQRQLSGTIHHLINRLWCLPFHGVPPPFHDACLSSLPQILPSKSKIITTIKMRPKRPPG